MNEAIVYANSDVIRRVRRFATASEKYDREEAAAIVNRAIEIAPSIMHPVWKQESRTVWIWTPENYTLKVEKLRDSWFASLKPPPYTDGYDKRSDMVKICSSLQAGKRYIEAAFLWQNALAVDVD